MNGLSASTLVSTHLGLHFIQNNLTGFHVHCGNSTRRINDWVWGIKAPNMLLEVTLLDGTMFRCTEDQLILSNPGEPGWYPIKQLKPGDYIALSLGSPEVKEEIKNKSMASKHVAILLALMHNQGFEFVTENTKTFNTFSHAYSQVFGLRLKGHVRDFSFYGEVGPKALEKLTDWGLASGDSVPWVILQSSNEVIASYLENITGPYTPNMAQQIKMLCQRLGYRCQIQDGQVLIIDKPEKSLVWSPLISINPYRKETVYAVLVSDDHAFTANGVAMMS